MLVNPGAIAVARDRIAPGDFYRPSHGTVFAAILAMDARDEAVDSITLAAELRRQGLLAEVGGQDFVFALPDLCPVAVRVAQYATIVRELARRRNGIVLSRRLERAFAEGTPVEQEAEGRELLRLLGISSGGCSSRAGASPIALERSALKSMAP